MSKTTTAKKQRKTNKILESSYYTGTNSGQQSPETISAYEFAKDSVPTLNKIASLKNQGETEDMPQALPFPLQDAVRQLADLYLKAQNLRNNSRDAIRLPCFKGKEAELESFSTELNNIMLECKKLATKLKNFSLAPR